MIKKVYLIFKTHLDIGFTDFAAEVIKGYLTSYLPRAIDTAYRTKDTDTPFIWSAGSWIIQEGLRYNVEGLEQAISDGLIRWHALPFTSHTELMNEPLFKSGLAISQRLDERFHTKTIAAKMSDVPGHTRGMVPLLAENGVELLHIGVNPATPMPNVPSLFRWRCGDSSIAVLYNAGGYGDFFDFEDFAVGFGCTGDNLGPQSAEELAAFYDRVQKKYPSAQVCAATLNDVAIAMRGLSLPELGCEIGDSWIHGAGTDPKKMCGYRALLRHIESSGDNFPPLDDSLLLVPEHTWGLDLKTHFPDSENYLPDAFAAHRSDAGTQKMEGSWQEQRDYVWKAASLLHFDLETEISVTEPDLSGFEPAPMRPAPFLLSYELFTPEDYIRFQQEYMQLDVDWAIWDLTKPGLPSYPGGVLEAGVSEIWQKGERLIYRLVFDEASSKKYGLPAFYMEQEGEQFTLTWLGKRANRLPEAFWLKWLDVGSENWKIEKMGQWIEPDDCADVNLLHAVGRAVRNEQTEIVPLDAPLVAPYGRNLLRRLPVRPKKDLYFNLYNNIWNTNFPLWYDEDAKFRFTIKRLHKMQ